MKKNIILLPVLFMLAACAASQQTAQTPVSGDQAFTIAETQAQVSTDANDIKDMKEYDDLIRKCSPLKLANGDLILNLGHVNKIFPGVWLLTSDIFLDPEVDWLHCAYIIDGPNDSQIIPQTQPISKFNGAQAKEYALGIQFSFDGSIFELKKGDQSVAISCNKSRSVACTEDEFRKIADVVVSRWP